MNEEQFQSFMSAFSSSQKLVADALAKFNQPPASVSKDHGNINPFECYDSGKEKFHNYLERFSNYCTMKGVTDQVKLAQLLCVSIGSTNYNSLAAYLGPDKPVNKLCYDDLVSNFKKMLTPKKNVVVSQHYFLNTYQKDSQSIAEYVASLQQDIAECDFYCKCRCNEIVSISDTFLRAQFIRGIKDDWIREQILQSDVQTFDAILSKATALEASRLESKALTSSGHHVNKISSSSSSSSHRQFQDRHSNSRSSSRQRQPDYRSLGIENLCIRCGRSNHKVPDCRINKEKLHCHACNKRGHVAKVCITTLLKHSKQHSRSNSKSKVSHLSDEDAASSTSYAYGMNHLEVINSHNVVDLFNCNQDVDKYLVTVQINGKSQQFEVDSGAKYSLLSRQDFDNLHLNLPLQPASIVFRSYSGSLIKPCGKVKINATYGNKDITSELHIVPEGCPLLGREWIRLLKINLQDLDNVHKVETTQIQPKIEDIFQKYSTVFEQTVGCVPDFQISLQLRKDAKPIFTPQRPVPYALQEKVNTELQSLEDMGVITPVNASDWGSPLVVIPKPDGGVRLCVDYKCGVNERLVQVNHPIRRIDDVLHSLRGSRYFCKLDLFKAYLHLKVDEDSSVIQTVTTHKGTFRVNRLSFGIKTAPAEFNKILSQILQGLDKTEAYFDDIICHGATMAECSKHLCACLQKLSEYNLHVNKQKCSFFQEKIEYLGHVVQFNKIMKSPVKTNAIKNMAQPNNADEVRRFLGLVTYYSRFIPDFSTISYPLRCLLKKNQKWFWSSNCEAAFLKLKDELCSDRVLVPFDPDLPVVLTTDGSPTGIAAVLSHVVQGVERPIAYASRSLSLSEINYSQLDREALAIVFGVTHFYNYLFGKHFTLVTDNQPLTRIFQHNKALPRMTSSRLLRYASFLSGFDYTVQFKKGVDNENVDCLSRSPVKMSNTPDQNFGEEVNQICSEVLFQISSSKITASTIQQETTKDPDLQKIIHELSSQCKDSEFTLVHGILFRGERVIIPHALRSTILEEIHETHLGISKMKQLARRYVFWNGIDKDIERLVRQCKECALTRSCPPKVSHPWETPEQNWERIHIDYAGPFENYYFLICMDAKSKWIEIKLCKQSPTSSSTIRLLDQIFSTHGYPLTMVSDNATIFQSDEFTSYCSTNGITQKFISAGHPATNGQAERMVQFLKNKLRSMSNVSCSMEDKVQQILWKYRATPLGCGKSPAELYLNRNIRIRLDSIFPHQDTQLNTNQTHASAVPATRSLVVGERVQVLFFVNNKKAWQFGSVQKRLGKCHYLIQLDSGRTLKRHINQLCATLVPKESKSVSFAIDQHVGTYQVPRPNDRHLEANQPASPVSLRMSLSPPRQQIVPPQLPIVSNRPQRARRPPRYLDDYQVEI